MGDLILVTITINPLARCDKAQDIYLQSKSRCFIDLLINCESNQIGEIKKSVKSTDLKTEISAFC